MFEELRESVRVVGLPMLDLFPYVDRFSRIRFDCRTSRHIASTEPLDAMCGECAALYCAAVNELRVLLSEGLQDDA